jgi:predicted nucleic-acid-binding protein
MYAIDTNVLIRIFVDDKHQQKQCEQARKFAEKQKKLWVSSIVQIELVWVLDYSYKLTKAQIITVLNHLYENDAYVLQNEAIFYQALMVFEESSANFSDCVIHVQSKKENLEVITFDKKFAKIQGVKLLF